MATIYLIANPQLLLHPDKLLSPDPDHRKNIDRISAFLGNAEGRDKIGKLVQFFARFLEGFLQEGGGSVLLGGEEGAKPYCQQLNKLWNGLQAARCWSWMGKSIIEWRTDIQTYESKTMAQEVKMLHMTARFFFAARWFFENFMILVKEKALMPRAQGGLLPLPDAATLNKVAKRFWLAAIVTAICTEMAKLRLMKQKYDALTDDRRAVATAKGRSKQDQVEAEKVYQDELTQLRTDAMQRLRTIVTNATDSPASISVGLGIPMSHMTVGGLMTIASFLQCQNLYPK
ncbi:unnamed protein product [Amoebophrya sp. A25]|nr:unnamed protein product [Amoebophrya sp. A25]|eukprot:GSA25T00015153001.1